jgi:DedD protein
MATAPTPGETEVKRRGRQRLIGAITLVLLLVVFVPMILDPEPRTSRPEPTLAIPAKDNAPPLPAPAQKAPTPGTPAKAAEVPAPVKAAETPAPVKAAETPAPVKGAEAPAPAKTPPPAGAPAAMPKLEGFAVQVGAFKEDAKLAQAREKLTAAKVSHYIERLPSGELTRLRAGPYATREAAEKAALTVKRAGLDGQVVPLP